MVRKYRFRGTQYLALQYIGINRWALATLRVQPIALATVLGSIGCLAGSKANVRVLQADLAVGLRLELIVLLAVHSQMLSNRNSGPISKVGMIKKPSTRMIALHLERKETAASRAFARASAQAEARIIAAVEAVRPFREKLEQVKLERAAFAAGRVFSAVERDTPDSKPDQLSANLSLSAFANALNAQTFGAADKTEANVELHSMST